MLYSPSQSLSPYNCTKLLISGSDLFWGAALLKIFVFYPNSSQIPKDKMKLNADRQWILALQVVAPGGWFCNSYTWSLFYLCGNCPQLFTWFCPCKKLVSESRKWLRSCTRAWTAQALPEPQNSLGSYSGALCPHLPSLWNLLFYTQYLILQGQ